jgi:hypothetical protein
MVGRTGVFRGRAEQLTSLMRSILLAGSYSSGDRGNREREVAVGMKQRNSKGDVTEGRGETGGKKLVRRRQLVWMRLMKARGAGGNETQRLPLIRGGV